MLVASNLLMGQSIDAMHCIGIIRKAIRQKKLRCCGYWAGSAQHASFLLSLLLHFYSTTVHCFFLPPSWLLPLLSFNFFIFYLYVPYQNYLQSLTSNFVEIIECSWMWIACIHYLYAVSAVKLIWTVHII
jgi:hypothetical protein